MHRWAPSELSDGRKPLLAPVFPKVGQVSEVRLWSPLDLKASLDARPYPPLTGSPILQRPPPLSPFHASPDLVPQNHGGVGKNGNWGFRQICYGVGGED